MTKPIILKNLIKQRFNKYRKSIEDTLIKNGFNTLGTMMNESRVGEVVNDIRLFNDFDLLNHLNKHDVSGKSKGCGCPYCQVHHWYVKYKNLYSHTKKRLDLITYQLQGYDKGLVLESLRPESINEYIALVEKYKEKYLRYKRRKKQLARLFRIPNYL